MTMRVLLVHENNPDEVQVGGTERYLVDIEAELTRAGHDIHVFVLSRHNRQRSKQSRSNLSKYKSKMPKPKQQDHKKRVIFRVAASNNLLYYFRTVIFYLAMYNKLRMTINRLKPDIIHLQNNYEYPITILMALRGQKVIQTIHDYTIIYPTAMCTHKHSCAGQSVIMSLQHGCMSWKRLIATGWFRYNRRFIDKCFVSQFVAPSKDLSLRLRKHGFGNVIHLPNFTSLTSVAPTDTPPTYPPSPLLRPCPVCGSLPPASFTATQKKRRIALYVGQLVAHKGVDILLHAYVLVESQIEDVALWIVGNGPAENDLKRLCEELGLHKVAFLGRLNHSDLSAIYDQVHVVVIPSLWFENAPLVAYEAMAHGRPILATRIGGLPELVTDSKNGFLFERGNSTELAQYIRKILTDDALAQSLGDGSRDKLAKMDTLADHVKRLVQIYDSQIMPKH